MKPNQFNTREFLVLVALCAYAFALVMLMRQRDTPWWD